MSATVAIQGKGKKVGTPNYKNEVLLNLIEFYLPAGNEQWKIVAQRYQEVSKEAFLRYHDDIKRHFNDKLCKKNQRQTGINNKSGPLPLVARAQEIQRKILINEATISYSLISAATISKKVILFIFVDKRCTDCAIVP